MKLRRDADWSLKLDDEQKREFLGCPVGSLPNFRQFDLVCAFRVEDQNHCGNEFLGLLCEMRDLKLVSLKKGQVGTVRSGFT